MRSDDSSMARLGAWDFLWIRADFALRLGPSTKSGAVSPQQLPSQRPPGIVGVLLDALPPGIDEGAVERILDQEMTAHDKAKQICALAGLKEVPPSFATLIEASLDCEYGGDRQGRTN